MARPSEAQGNDRRKGESMARALDSFDVAAVLYQGAIALRDPRRAEEEVAALRGELASLDMGFECLSDERLREALMEWDPFAGKGPKRGALYIVASLAVECGAWDLGDEGDEGFGERLERARERLKPERSKARERRLVRSMAASLLAALRACSTE